MRAAILDDDGRLPADWSVRAGLYERVSTLAKTERARQQARSIEQQNGDNVAACQTRRWTIVDRYPDPGLSASRFTQKSRPEHTRLLRDVAAGKVDVVVLWEPSRGDRKLATWAAFLDVCRTHGVLIYVTCHHHLYDMRNERDWRALADDGIDAAMESEKLSRRCQRGQAASADEGRPHGHTPYGYERIYDPLTGDLIGQQIREATPEELAAGRPAPSDIAREIITRIAGGHPVRALAADLTARGIPAPNGGAWTHTTLRQIALNPAYIGKRKHRGTLHDADWPALVKEDVYWSAVRVLTSRQPASGRPGKLKYLLSYLATCAECDGTLRVYPYRSKAGAARHDGLLYSCYKGCAAVYVNQMDRYVELAVWDRLSRKDLFRYAVQATDAESVAAHAEIGELHARLEDFTVKAASGAITATSFGKIERTLLADIASAERKAAALSVPYALRELAGQPYEVIRAKWRSVPLPARREVCRALFTSIQLKYQLETTRKPRWDEQRGKWVVDIKHQRKTFHWSAHHDPDEAQQAMNTAYAELATMNPRRRRGTYELTSARVVLSLRQPSQPGSDTHT